MKKTIKNLALNPLVAGSFFVVSGGFVANIFNFLFNLLMSRNLRIEDYGVLISLVSIITLLSIPVNAIHPLIVSVAGKYFANEDLKGVKTFYFKILRPLLIIGSAIIVLSLLASNAIGNFLKIDNGLLIFIAAVNVFISYIGTNNLAFLQSGLYFRASSVISGLSAFSKVIFGFIAVVVGWGVVGGMSAYLAGFIVTLLLSLFVLRKILFVKFEKLPKISYREFFSYGIPSTVSILALSSLITTDIILVKHLFNPQQAGLYAGISLVGRIIFYISAPISSVMFPLIVQRYNRKENYNSILFLSIILVIVPSLFITAFYYIFPSFTILFVLKNPSYLEGVEFLGLFGIFTTIYSVLSLMVYYYLSIKKTTISYLMAVGAILQALIIYFFHKEIVDVLLISIAVSGLLLIFLLIYYFINKERIDP